MPNTEQKLQLQAEAEAICAFLQQRGYQLDNRGVLAWKVSKGSDVFLYILSYLPFSVGDWGLTPRDGSPAFKELNELLQQALTAYRGGGR